MLRLIVATAVVLLQRLEVTADRLRRHIQLLSEVGDSDAPRTRSTICRRRSSAAFDCTAPPPPIGLPSRPVTDHGAPGITDSAENQALSSRRSRTHMLLGTHPERTPEERSPGAGFG
jgi:hypothetical protein